MTENISHYPLHWTSKPLGVISSLRSETGYPKEELLSVYLDRGVVLFSDVDEKRTNATSSDLSGYQLVEVGDFVLNNQQAWRGSVGVSFYRGIVSPAYLVLRLSDELHPNFANYMFRNRDMVGHFVICSKGVGTIQRNLYWPQVKRVPVVYPDLPEQKAISNLLDQKTTQIDKTIRVKEQQITLLKERKQILIQNAVTRGLNPDVPMRDSGVDWIGKFPAHWIMRRSKFVFCQRKELARKDDVQLSATQSYGVIPQEEYEAKVGRKVVRITFNLEKRKHVEVDDFVISMRSFQGGLERAWASGCIRSSYVVLRPVLEISPDYYGYLFKSQSYIQALQTTANFIRDGQDLNFDNFSMVGLPIPPADEQKRIARYLKAQIERSDGAVALLEQQITKLKEYKATLINSAVTGKIKVPGVMEPVQGVNEPEAREVCQ